jgi:tRNA(His) 5'-end guanylyltransferase
MDTQHIKQMMQTTTIYDVLTRAVIPTSIAICANDGGEIVEMDLPFENGFGGYIMNPNIGRKVWDALGDKLSANEKSCPNAVTGNKFITLRLDGLNFSSVTSRLKNMNVFEKGYSKTFADMMISITNELCDKIQGVVFAFTQSDEITLVINQCAMNKHGEFNAHMFNGRRDKLNTSTSGYATMLFNRLVTQHILTSMRNVGATFDDIIDMLSSLPNIIFDCRMASYDTLMDAFELVIWRAYDCSVNGVSSGILMCDLPNSKCKIGLPTGNKLLYMHENALLPLQEHQAYGTFIKRVRNERVCQNIKSGAEHVKMVLQNEVVRGNVLVNIMNGTIVVTPPL